MFVFLIKSEEEPLAAHVSYGIKTNVLSAVDFTA